jgi:large subunit ribosomal protein L17
LFEKGKLMRHRKKVVKLNRTESHRKALMRNMVSQLFVHERVTTTEAKAKALRPFAERLITMARDDNVHARRKVARYISDKDVIKKLFMELSPRFRERPGGYTRIMKLSNRPGDNASMSIIELVESENKTRPTATIESGKSAGSSEKAEAGKTEKKKLGLKGKLSRSKGRNKKEPKE